MVQYIAPVLIQWDSICYQPPRTLLFVYGTHKDVLLQCATEVMPTLCGMLHSG